jgi:hypothetical protein
MASPPAVQSPLQARFNGRPRPRSTTQSDAIRKLTQMQVSTISSYTYRFSGHFISCWVQNGSDCNLFASRPGPSSPKATLNALKLWAVLAISGTGQLNIVVTMIALRCQTPMANNLCSFSGSNCSAPLNRTFCTGKVQPHETNMSVVDIQLCGEGVESSLVSSSACTALSCHCYVASMIAQGIGARFFLLLLPENTSMLAIFGSELCVAPEGDVQNPREPMNELSHSNDSHHRYEIVFQPIIHASYHSSQSSRSLFWQHQTRQQASVKREELHIQPEGSERSCSRSDVSRPYISP